MVEKPAKCLVVVGGPTASGKTGLAIQLANHYNTEIISADSRQFYKELNIGVARPSVEELKAAKHHFIAHRSIRDDYSAGMFERDVIKKLDDLFQHHDTVIMLGGSGLFINAVLNGFHEAPKDDGTIRKEIQLLFDSKGLAGLQELHASIDPTYAEIIDKQNPQRLMRAIERFKLTGLKHADQTSPSKAIRNFKHIEVAINHSRAKLYERINARVDQMMEDGLLDEVKSHLPFKELNALQTVGYTELFRYLDGELTIEEAIELIKQNTRRYAKRQMTWFRNKSKTVWFGPDRFGEVVAFVEGQMKQ